VTLVAVRVLDCRGSGSWSGVIAGVDWVTEQQRERGGPALANMSLGGGASTSVDDAVRNSVRAGVTYAVAAGNGDRLGRQQPACNYSPARVREALTVGATTNTDAKTSWSNYGECVDLFAPGASITSSWHTNDAATNTISGTSMASPHVAGVAALYLETAPSSTPEQVFQAVSDASTKSIVTSSSTSKNDLLFSGAAPAAGNGTTHILTVGIAGSGSGTVTSNPIGIACGSDCSEAYAQDTTVILHAAPAQGSTFTGWEGCTGASSCTLIVTAATTVTATFTLDTTPGGGDSTSGITLTVQGRKAKGFLTADLTWAGAEGSHVIVTRRAASIEDVVLTVLNNGAHTDQTNYKGGGTLYYQICEVGTSTCSPEVSVTF
jgi:subtilisin family serine protease